MGQDKFAGIKIKYLRNPGGITTIYKYISGSLLANVLAKRKIVEVFGKLPGKVRRIDGKVFRHFFQ